MQAKTRRVELPILPAAQMGANAFVKAAGGCVEPLDLDLVRFFGLRLLVQLPLYWANLVEQLAMARAIMGAPAYAGLLALTWVLLRRIQQSKAVD